MFLLFLLLLAWGAKTNERVVLSKTKVGVYSETCSSLAGKSGAWVEGRFLGWLGCYLGGEAAGAVLDKMAGKFFRELGGVVGEAEF